MLQFEHQHTAELPLENTSLSIQSHLRSIPAADSQPLDRYLSFRLLALLFWKTLCGSDAWKDFSWFKVSCSFLICPKSFVKSKSQPLQKRAACLENLSEVPGKTMKICILTPMFSFWFFSPLSPQRKRKMRND